ncbi:hypothetical protein Acor_67060 [Acrocarpospora corrugata]|uniref:Core-binding (CB) domain-containing protein n=1 Tax=Acrocarpospora corrugata TaxID=35763 RepID=A0A5M3WE00_9ACTN|nr:hypothetical protein [Acrocarpospora corrugata]GES04638.1 hypothetical protein Acor_67060 [Acrocarpospora corrugata]
MAASAVDVRGLGQVDRPLLERYLAYLQVELGSTRTVRRHMIGQLNLFFTAIRQHGWASGLQISAMFFPEDMPKEAKALPRALSEHVMAQLERPDNLKRWDDPAGELITMILMRWGLRVRDALRVNEATHRSPSRSMSGSSSLTKQPPPPTDSSRSNFGDDGLQIPPDDTSRRSRG